MGIDIKVNSLSSSGLLNYAESYLPESFNLLKKNMDLAEQKVKVPHMHCDSRVQTVSADVMNLPKSKLKSLSPKVTSLIKSKTSCRINIECCIIPEYRAQLVIFLIKNVLSFGFFTLNDVKILVSVNNSITSIRWKCKVCAMVCLRVYNICSLP